MKDKCRIPHPKKKLEIVELLNLSQITHHLCSLFQVFNCMNTGMQ